MRLIKRVSYQSFTALPGLHAIRNTTQAQNPCTLSMWFMQKVLGFNRPVYWPVHFSSRINNFQNIVVGVDSAPGYEPGCYIQGSAPVSIGDYTQFAANVGVISRNHDVHDLRLHVKEPGGGFAVKIGSYCWIGMGAVILPGVELGDFTIVGANTVVTRSFPEGHCVIAGSPAKVIRELDRGRCARFENDVPYHGYIPADRFEVWRARHLRV